MRLLFKKVIASDGLRRDENTRELDAPVDNVKGFQIIKGHSYLMHDRPHNEVVHFLCILLIVLD